METLNGCSSIPFNPSLFFETALDVELAVKLFWVVASHKTRNLDIITFFLKIIKMFSSLYCIARTSSMRLRPFCTHLQPETAILQKALEHVPTHGWTVQSLSHAATDLGFSSIAHGMFPNGGMDLVTFFMSQSTSNVSLQYKKEEEEEKSLSDSHVRLERVLKMRLQELIPYLKRWPEVRA